MSQPNNEYPSFHFHGPYYASESTRSFGNTAFSQWDSQGSRMELSAPSPSLTVQSTRSAPNPTSLSNLDFLAVPPGHRPRSSTDMANPLTRFYSENVDSPWSTERMRNHNVSVGGSLFSQVGIGAGSYRNDALHHTNTLAPASDSGYRSLPTHSVISDSDMADRGLPVEVTYPLRNTHVGSVPSDGGDGLRIARSVDQESHYSGGSGRRSTGQRKLFPCPKCNEVSKCKSDFKKHMSRHEKRYKCNIPNCRRGPKGFTTQNDLDRHKKSVHRIGALTNSYQCASEHCRNKGKIWPRLDNFKQHISRMHKDEDEQDIIRRSVYVPEPSPSEDVMSMAPMDTTLAGIGTERQFSSSSNELDDPVSGISLTPDQECNRWSSFDPSNHNFSMDVDHTRSLSAGYQNLEQGVPIAFRQVNATADQGHFQRLDALADVATSHALDQEDDDEAPPLSKAPQTKADQQRAALQKFSKLIQDASTSNPGEGLEDVILRVLSKPLAGNVALAQQPTSNPHSDPSSHALLETHLQEQAATLTKQEALKATQAMSELIRRAPIPRPRSTSSPLGGMRKCAHCPAVVARACDMRKHMMRHTKPYGCTFPKCRKRFGAKSDWKRHENSQHFQSEAFSCRAPCGQLFHRVTVFETHLKEDHKMDNREMIENEVKVRRIGKNGQGRFWCGFCRDIIELKRLRNEAWDERFDHIDNHYNKEKKRVEEWLCVEAMKTKGELFQEVKSGFDDDAEALSPSRDTQSPDRPPYDLQEASVQNLASRPPLGGFASRRSELRKRFADAETSAPPPVEKRAKSEVFIFCCACEGGPWATHTFLSCVDCNHQLCDNCNTTALVGLE